MNELYEHQKIALRKLSNGKILWGGVGSGKTRVAVEYYKLREAPRDVYVITTARKRDSLDWEKEFVDVGIGARTGPTTASDRGNKKARSDDTGGHGESAARIVGDSARGGPWPNADSATRGDPVGQALPAGSSDRDGGSRRGRAGSDDQLQNESRTGQYPYVLTVDSWNNLAKYANVAGAFFIFDEQRLVGSGEWSRKFLRIAKHNHWIMLSATPGDTWMDYIPLFVANGFYKNRTDFKREHVVYNTFTKFPKVDRYIGVSRLARHRHDILVHMPFERHTKRRHVVVPLPYDKEMLDRVLKDRWHVYEERPLIDVGEMFLVARRVVNSDPSRLEMVCELWKNHPRLIVFYNFNYELAALRGLSSSLLNERKPDAPTADDHGLKKRSREASPLSAYPVHAVTKESEPWKTTSSGGSTKSLAGPTLRRSIDGQTNSFTEISRGLNRSESSTPSSKTLTESSTTAISSSTSIAEWNGHRHQPIPSTDRWLYLCQYTAAAEAWNCIETDAMILYSKNYSWKVMEQAYGRIDRLNTLFKDLWYYGFTSDSFVDKAIQRSLDAKESFNVKKYKRLFEG